MEFSAVDIGNTAIKITVLGSGNVSEKASCATLKEALEWLAANGRGPVAFCSTRDLKPEEASLAAGAGWWEFKGKSEIPLEVDYLTPGTLGPDRLAGVVGANYLFRDRNILVADAGTALTLDIVTAGGRFAGGNIVPGLRMRFRALHDFTSRLPLVEWNGEKPDYWGGDTDSAIRNGVVWGMVNEITGALSLSACNNGVDLLVLTGGDANRLFPLLVSENSSGCEKVYEPDLIAFGLMEAYKYNHDKEI